MRKPSLTLDTFVAALAVLGATATAGCSKADRGVRAAPEPPAAAASPAPKGESAGPAAVAPAEAPPPAAAPQAAASQAPQAAQAADEKPAASARKPSVPVAARAVDGGLIKRVGEEDTKKAGMSCGAGTCSADMKKGN